MNAKLKAVEDIRKLGRMLKGMLDACDDLEAIGSIEQATQETTSRLESCRLNEAKVQADLIKANTILEAKKQEAFDIEANAVKSAEEISKDAYAKAHEECEIILKDAKEQADLMTSVARKQRDAYLDEVSKMKDVVEYLKAEIISKEGALSTINNHLAELRAKVGL